MGEGGGGEAEKLNGTWMLGFALREMRIHSRLLSREVTQSELLFDRISLPSVLKLG